MKKLLLAAFLAAAIPASAQVVPFGTLGGGGGTTTIISGTTPITGGGTTQVCYNQAGFLKCGDAGLIYAESTDILTMLGGATIGSTTTAGTGTTTILATITGSSATSNFLNITGTFPATLSAETRAITLNFTGDNDAQTQRGIYLAGPTSSSGSVTSAGLYITNNGNPGLRNSGIDVQLLGSGSSVVGGSFIGSPTPTNAWGVFGRGARDSSTFTAGGQFWSGTGTTQVGIWAGLGTSNVSTTVTGSAAIIGDNGSVAATIASLRDNGTEKWAAVDGGFIRAVEGHSYLSSDYTNATTTFSNTALSVNVESGRKYRWKASLFLTESTAADGVKLDFSGGSAAATSFIGTCVLSNAVGAALTQTNATTAALATVINIGATTDTAVHLYECAGGFEPSGAGTFIIRAAQNAHTTGTLTIKRGSFLFTVDTP